MCIPCAFADHHSHISNSKMVARWVAHEEDDEPTMTQQEKWKKCLAGRRLTRSSVSCHHLLELLVWVHVCCVGKGGTLTIWVWFASPYHNSSWNQLGSPQKLGFQMKRLEHVLIFVSIWSDPFQICKCVLLPPSCYRRQSFQGHVLGRPGGHVVGKNVHRRWQDNLGNKRRNTPGAKPSPTMARQVGRQATAGSGSGKNFCDASRETAGRQAGRQAPYRRNLRRNANNTRKITHPKKNLCGNGPDKQGVRDKFTMLPAETFPTKTCFQQELESYSLWPSGAWLPTLIFKSLPKLIDRVKEWTDHQNSEARTHIQQGISRHTYRRRWRQHAQQIARR